jgi:hypothetical protein
MGGHPQPRIVGRHSQEHAEGPPVHSGAVLLALEQLGGDVLRLTKKKKKKKKKHGEKNEEPISHFRGVKEPIVGAKLGGLGTHRAAEG